MPSPTPPLDAVEDYLAGARWFAGKGRAHQVTHVRRVAEVPCMGPSVTIDLVTVEYADGDVETYQLPLVHYLDSGEPALSNAAIYAHTYDAVYDPVAVSAMVAAFGSTTGDVRWEKLTTWNADPALPSKVFAGEQSNTSIVLGDQALLKVFRKLSPGLNPDIEIHRALTEAGNADIGALYGWVEHDQGNEVVQLGMLQEFLSGAHEGWAAAVASVAELADFTTQAHSLGGAVARVHAALADAFPVTTIDAAALTASMGQRLRTTAAEVPALVTLSGDLSEIFRAAASSGDQPAQRVHGDLHLGQTLEARTGWKLVDFEGEPVKSLAERTRPDSPWRDVAGMLRSFEYAGATAFTADQEAIDLWVHAAQEAFLAGYLDDRPISAGEQALLNAYVADKAIYEVLYETRNRPDWVHIPLAGLGRILRGR